MNVLKREKAVFYVYHHRRRDEEWFVALRTPDACLWRLQGPPLPSREAAEQEALQRAAICERTMVLETEIRFEVPQIVEGAVPVVEWRPTQEVLARRKEGLA